MSNPRTTIQAIQIANTGKPQRRKEWLPGIHIKGDGAGKIIYVGPDGDEQPYTIQDQKDLEGKDVRRKRNRDREADDWEDFTATATAARTAEPLTETTSLNAKQMVNAQFINNVSTATPQVMQ